MIRKAKETDLPTIVEIYNSTIPDRLATADLNPVSVESRLSWFRDRDWSTRPLWVFEMDNNVAGWLGFQSFYGRPAYRQTAEVSIYVASAYRRQGIGNKLLQQAILQSSELKINTLLGFIFAHNQPSLELFKQHQFSQWGYLPQVADMDGIKRDLVIVGRRL
ncbi:MAG: GNAT family N-acetyltransferase [Xenococcaceae cyanobacterium MO_188.B32]|nr:GNAT family N-acetyltransferase [Xenococcaceae cyanobacterium MO_188.B32]